MHSLWWNSNAVAFTPQSLGVVGKNRRKSQALKPQSKVLESGTGPKACSDGEAFCQPSHDWMGFKVVRCAKKQDSLTRSPGRPCPCFAVFRSARKATQMTETSIALKLRLKQTSLLNHKKVLSCTPLCFFSSLKKRHHSPLQGCLSCCNFSPTETSAEICDAGFPIQQS